jgi:predicted HNH restriction endonuclease
MNHWWVGTEGERYWLEATDRVDIGTDLKAPEADDSGRANWRYSLFKEAQPGDVVLHYDKRPASSGIVGWSIVSGKWQPAPIIWAARGTYARDKGTQPHERPGFRVPLEGFQKLHEPITLDRIRSVESQLRAVLQEHKLKYGEHVYFPFELSEKRPIRLLQGYAFKLPRAFLDVFSELRKLTDVPGTAETISETEHHPHRNAAWARDELILALELYMRNPASPPGKESSEVNQLSELLNKIGSLLGNRNGDTFRNPNGVYMKMMNFRRFDPASIAAGKVGLTRGNKDEEAVWREFAHDRQRLASVVEAIRQAAQLENGELAELGEDDAIAEAEEGRLLTRIHRTRERSRKLVEDRKLHAFRQFGRLSCEACEFDFEKRYGERGRGFIEAHHTRPVAMLTEGSKTKLEELALLCANCHRMIHSVRPWLTVDELRGLLSHHERE